MVRYTSRQINPCEPFDGVRPEDHPDRYRDFFIHHCYRQSPDVPYFYDINDFEILICNQCITNARIQPTPSFTRNEGLHNIGTANVPPLYCDFCRRDVQVIRPVIECGACTQFLLELNQN